MKILSLNNLFLLSVVFIGNVSCENSTKEKIELTVPVPSPSPAPEPPSAPPPSLPPPAKLEDPPVKIPKFLNGFPTNLKLNEGELFQLQLIVDSESLTQFFSQCTFDCPESLTVDPNSGLVSFRPTFNDAGNYEVELIAIDSEGVTGSSPSINIEVVDVNRSPVITEVKLVTTGIDLTRPGRSRFISCSVTGNDPDKETLIFERNWFLNDSLIEANQLTIELSNFRPNDVVRCSAKLTDAGGLSSELISSENYLVPNAPPLVESLIVKNVNGTNDFGIGSDIRCETTTSDGDGDIVSVVRATIKNRTKNTVVREFSPFLASDSHRLTNLDSHAELFCEVEISDGTVSIFHTGESSNIVNSPPSINQIIFGKALSGSAGPNVRSGDSVICEITFSDADNDSVTPLVSFYVDNQFRGFGVSLSSTSVRRQYQLITFQQTANAGNADTRGKLIECRASVTDFYGATSATTSLPIVISDSAPIISHAGGGSLSQVLQTGQAFAAVRYEAVDFDGDALTISAVSDTCSVFGQNFLSISTAQKEIRGLTVGAAIYPQSGRNCTAQFRAAANGLESSLLSINISSPNRPPVISCGGLLSGAVINEGSSIVRILELGPKDFYQRLLGPGQQIGRTPGQLVDSEKKVICEVSDPDGSSFGSTVPPNGGAGDGFEFKLVKSTGGGCEHYFFPTGRDESQEFSFSNFSSIGKEILGRMGGGNCLIQVYANDGAQDSNIVTINMKSPIEIVQFSNPETSQDCKIEAGFTSPLVSQYNPSLSLLPLGVSDVLINGQMNLLNPGTLSNKVVLDATYSDLSSNYIDTGFQLDFSFKIQEASVRPPLLNVVEYKQNYSSSYNVVSSPLTGLLSVKIDDVDINSFTTQGSQASPSKSCLDRSTCSGVRASISLGRSHTCYLTDTSEARCFGDNSNQQTGQQNLSGNTLDDFISNPSLVVLGQAPLANIVSVHSGNDHSCALAKLNIEDPTGTIACWGKGSLGQLGTATATQSGLVPPSTALPGYVISGFDGSSNPVVMSNVVKLAVGANHSCAILSLGELFCWGAADRGQIGVDPSLTGIGIQFFSGTPYLPLPRRVLDQGVPVLAESIWAGGDVSCYKEKISLAIKCFGYALKGQLGFGQTQPLSTPSEFRLPLPMITSGLDVTQISIGRTGFINEQIGTSCVLSSSGDIICFGQGGRGQLGTSSNFHENYETYFPDTDPGKKYASNSSAIALADRSTCRLSYSGNVHCVGDNTNGQLGNGTIGTFSIFEQLVRSSGGTLLNMVTVAGNGTRFCGVDASGVVWCWGGGISEAEAINGSSQAAAVFRCERELIVEKLEL